MEPLGSPAITFDQTETPPEGSLLNKERPIPCLDGLRAISIFFVLVNHLLLVEEGGPPGVNRWRIVGAIIGNGTLGVKIFFVISGFLITTLLLQEQQRRGAISLKRFYIKRFFRIFPAYYVLIIAVGILTALGWMNATRSDFIHAATFTWIYHFSEWNWCFLHTWSLSVEEQFYLMWPLAMVLLGPRRAIGLALGFILVLPFARLGFSWTGHGLFRGVCYLLLAGRFDVLMFGCLLALLWSSRPIQTFFGTSIKGYVVVLAGVFTIVISSGGVVDAAWAKNDFLVMFQDTLVGMCIAGTIAYLLMHPASAVGRLLNSPPLVFVGVLSYSIYLWQQLFLTPHPPANVLQRFPVNLLCVALVAFGSFRLVERPFLRLRRRFLDP